VPEEVARRWAPPTAPGPARWRFGLYAAHLLTSWSIATSNVLLGLAVLAMAPVVGRGRIRLPATARPPLRLAVAYLVLLVASVAASVDPPTSLRALSEIFSFATFALTLVLVQGERRLRWLVDALILTATAVAGTGLFQLLLGYGELEHRIRGPFSHYMTFAGFLLIVDLLLASRLLARRRVAAATGPSALLDRVWVAWFCVVVISAALIGSLTRNAMLGLLTAGVLLVSLTRPRLLLLAPVFVVAVLLVAPIPVVARVLSIGDLSDVSTYDRICMAEAGLRMVEERPLLGIGPDQVKRLYPIYRHPTAPRLLVPHLHDAYLELAAERGIPALAVFLTLYVSALATAVRGFRRGGADADLHLGALGALVAFAVAALFENNWGDTEVQRLALFVLALPFSVAAPANDGAADAAPLS